MVIPLSGKREVFAIPIDGKFLVYAPLSYTIALVNGATLRYINDVGSREIPANVRSFVERLHQQRQVVPKVRTGPVLDPMFLGIIPTRGCNMACHYCDFAAPKHDSPVMSLKTARNAIDAYFNILTDGGARNGEIQFFGGEPFFADKVVHFVVEYATLRAQRLGLAIHFEATTNGLYSEERCRWIADRFDAIVLSLDGPAAIQNRYRPAHNGRGTFDVVARSARIFSEGLVELAIRVCVTNETVDQIPELASWIAVNFRPQLVCFESLTPSPLAEAAGLQPPNPWNFAVSFDEAARILQQYRIKAVLSTADISVCRSTFCLVGNDALIVSPDGAIDACYLLEQDWQQRGMDMRLGWLQDDRFELSSAMLQRVRRLTVESKSLCKDCLCRFHCAGGCPVNHDSDKSPGDFDDLCIQTRLVTVARLLHEIGQDSLANVWLRDYHTNHAAMQVSDRVEKVVAQCLP